LELNAFNTQIERFTHAETAAVQEAGDQVGGIARPVADGLEGGWGFGDGWGVAQAGRPLGAEDGDVCKGCLRTSL